MTSLIRHNILYAVLSALMLTVSFPPGLGGWFVWIGLIPLLLAVESQSARSRFILGIIAGMAHYLTLMYWVIIVLNRYGGLPLPVSMGALILLSFYLSLYFGLFCLGAGFIPSGPFYPLAMSMFWVSLEFIRASILSGFPWCLLGYTQFKQLFLVQVSDVTGVYGISFLIVFANALLFSLFVSRERKKIVRLLPETVLFLICLASVLNYGYSWQKKKEPEVQTGKSYPLAVVQGNIDQSLKWTGPYQEKTIRIYQELTRQTRSAKPWLIIWPETAAPFFFQNQDDLAGRIRELAVESDAHLIFGSPAFGYEKGLLKYFNRAYHIDPMGTIRGYYDKVHLVPFGEYVPLKRFLPFIKKLVTAAGDFTPGEKISPLPVGSLSVGMLICFESIFPEIARVHTRQGADMLVNITNDAWYGRSSAPYQTLCMSVFRAIENRRPLIRAANTGFSAFIDNKGKILAESGLFCREILIKEINMVKPSLTFYTRYGDLFAVACLFFSAIILIFRMIRFKL